MLKGSCVIFAGFALMQWVDTHILTEVGDAVDG